MEIINLLPIMIGAYVLGSIPTAVWIGRVFYNIDVREHGSGNAGATNTLRVLGKKAGFTVLFLDFLKGFLATNLVLTQSSVYNDTPAFRNIQMILAICAVIGHIYPLFANFKGGKGIATLLGAVIAISWQVSILCVLLFVFTVWVTKYISLGSMMGCLGSPFFVWWIYGSNEKYFIYFCISVAIMVVYTHRTNIGRLRKGTESRFSFNKKPEISHVK